MYRSKHSKPTEFEKHANNVCADIRRICKGYIFPRHSKKRILPVLMSLIAGLLIIDTVMMSLYVSTLTPYAITRDGKPVCYVKTKKEAESAIRETADALTKEDAKVVSVSSDLKVEKASVSKRKEIEEDPAAVLTEKAKNSEVKIKVETIETETSDTTETVIEKDDEMLAGTSETVEEGTPTEEKKTYARTIINGETVDEHELSAEIEEPGSPAVIKKGTRGLPEGEDFETYDGYPVCENGEDIMKTAAGYIDKTPYVWGGKDLETGVDCSGFVICIYRLYGIELGYPLEEEGISVPYEEAMPGDILYFPGHFGLYLGDGRMIHASRPGTYVMEAPIGDREILDVRRIIF